MEVPAETSPAAARLDDQAAPPSIHARPPYDCASQTRQRHQCAGDTVPEASALCEEELVVQPDCPEYGALPPGERVAQILARVRIEQPIFRLRVPLDHHVDDDRAPRAGLLDLGDLVIGEGALSRGLQLVGGQLSGGRIDCGL